MAVKVTHCFIHLSYIPIYLLPKQNFFFLNVYGQESPRWISLFKHAFFVVVENIQKRQIFKNKIGQWIPDSDGRGIARDIKTNYFYFQNSTKNGNKVGTIYKVGTLFCISAF